MARWAIQFSRQIGKFPETFQRATWWRLMPCVGILLWMHSTGIQYHSKYPKSALIHQWPSTNDKNAHGGRDLANGWNGCPWSNPPTLNQPNHILGWFEHLVFNSGSSGGFIIVTVLPCVHKFTTITPRVPVNNSTAAHREVASLPMNCHPHPSSTRESILLYARGDDCALWYNWNWRVGGGLVSLLNVFWEAGHFENDCFRRWSDARSFLGELVFRK